MKSSRFKYDYRDSASHLHQAVGECLRNSKIFGGFKIYQEYPVSKVNPNYKNNAHRFDWVIKDLYLIIECHGIQHFQSSDYFASSTQQSVDNFHRQVIRDRLKKEAAEEVGYSYIVIKCSDARRLDDGFIWKLYQESVPDFCKV